MQRYDIFDYHCPKNKFTDRPSKPEIDIFEPLLSSLDQLSGGKYYSQSTMETAWNLAFQDKFVYQHRILHQRRPTTQMLDGVRFGQC
eukprot:9114987-Alexandrium_andersonii.AAC.1